MVAPTVNASAHVAVRPNSVICLTTKRLAMMQQMHTKATSAERPSARDPSANVAIIIVWAINMYSFMGQVRFFQFFHFSDTISIINSIE